MVRAALSLSPGGRRRHVARSAVLTMPTAPVGERVGEAVGGAIPAEDGEVAGVPSQHWRHVQLAMCRGVHLAFNIVLKLEVSVDLEQGLGVFPLILYCSLCFHCNTIATYRPHITVGTYGVVGNRLFVNDIQRELNAFLQPQLPFSLVPFGSGFHCQLELDQGGLQSAVDSMQQVLHQNRWLYSLWVPDPHITYRGI